VDNYQTQKVFIRHVLPQRNTRKEDGKMTALATKTPEYAEITGASFAGVIHSEEETNISSGFWRNWNAAVNPGRG